MNFSQQDELAALFARSMHVSFAPPAAQQQQQVQQRVDIAPPTYESVTNAPLQFASVHYTPTAHIRSDNAAPVSQTDSGLTSDMIEALQRNSVDPAALQPSQIQLFINAGYEQRLRLLELWRIAPPSHPQDSAHANYIHGPTSVEREEQEAKVRYEARMSPQHIPSAVASMSPIRTASEAAWPPAARMRAASILARANHVPPRQQQHDAEPYMLHGYAHPQQANGMSQRASEPVYAMSQGLWQQQQQQQQQVQTQQQQENQYYEQIRNHADWERMNARIMQERLCGMGRDEEMVM